MSKVFNFTLDDEWVARLGEIREAARLYYEPIKWTNAELVKLLLWRYRPERRRFHWERWYKRRHRVKVQPKSKPSLGGGFGNAIVDFLPWRR